MRVIDYINQGGPIMYILLVLNIIGFAIMLSKLFIFSNEQKKVNEQAKNLGDKIKEQTAGKEISAILEIAKAEVANHVSTMEKGLNTVKIIASISPLLGLLGTVLGVLIAFQVMSQTGLNNPASFAQGISMALITTVGGMIVAIPHYVGHNYLVGMIDKFELNLEKNILRYIL